MNAIKPKTALISLSDKSGLPCFVKASKSGSSYGITKVYKAEEFENAFKIAFKVGSNILIESFLDGIEVSVGVITYNNKTICLPITEIISENDFFDYEAKYNSNAKTKHLIPVDLSKNNLAKITSIAREAHKIIGCKGVTRSDFKFFNGKFYLLEINTQPGMTKLSLVPEIAKHKGISFIKLIEWIKKHFQDPLTL